MLYDMLKEVYEDGERKGKIEGKAEAILELLDDLGEVPEELVNSILELEDIYIIGLLLKAAQKADSLEQFIAKKNAICSKKRGSCPGYNTDGCREKL